MSRLNLILALAITFCAGEISPSSAGATDFRSIKSGLLLGAYASPAQGGMEITGLIPGFSAEGHLLTGDVLIRATTNGLTMHQLRSNYEMENAKQAIGANRQTAIEILRPGQGLIYAWVEFTPVASPTGIYSMQKRAMFRLETEKPGAHEMFRTTSNAGQQTVEVQKPGFSDHEIQSGPMPFTDPSSDRAASLFRRM